MGAGKGRSRRAKAATATMPTGAEKRKAALKRNLEVRAAAAEAEQNALPWGISGASVDWSNGGIPRLHIDLNSVPDRQDLIYDKLDMSGISGSGPGGFFYHAENADGFVDFFQHNPDSPTGGLDGNVRVLVGPENFARFNYHGAWSSRASVSNGLGYNPCIEAVAHVQGSATPRSICISTELAEKIIDKHCPDLKLKQEMTPQASRTTSAIQERAWTFEQREQGEENTPLLRVDAPEQLQF